MPKTDRSMYFTNVAVLGRDHVALGGHRYAADEDEDPSTRLVLFDGDWQPLADLPESVAGLRSTSDDIPFGWYAMLRDGVLHHWVGEDHEVEIIDPDRGMFFHDIRHIGASWYACGMARQVFRKQGQVWSAVDAGVFLPEKPQRGLMSIDGHSEGDIYAAGSGGEIWHFDGRQWENLESPTNSVFTSVLCTGGITYLAGGRGAFCRGDVDGWQLLPGANPQYMLTDLVAYDGRIYVCSEFDLSILEGDELIPVRTGIQGEVGFGALASGDGQLWSVGGESVLRLDGESWTKFDCPWN